MTQYEYKVVPAPTKGQKAQGIKAPEARFAHTVEGALNAQATDGWEFVRSDILPSEERHGLTSTQTVYRTLLVFRRARGDEQQTADEVIAAAQDVAKVAAPAKTSGRREPSLKPVWRTRADPAEPSKPDTKPDTLSLGVPTPQPPIKE
jgi:hypothetical protein